MVSLFGVCSQVVLLSVFQVQYKLAEELVLEVSILGQIKLFGDFALALIKSKLHLFSLKGLYLGYSSTSLIT